DVGVEHVAAAEQPQRHGVRGPPLVDRAGVEEGDQGVELPALAHERAGRGQRVVERLAADLAGVIGRLGGRSDEPADLPGLAAGQDKALRVTTPMSPPAWALLEREVLKASSEACGEFYRRYFDDRGWLLCVERWGGDDGPDDAIENCNDWPILHALGGSD